VHAVLYRGRTFPEALSTLLAHEVGREFEGGAS
jgi:hypothetical protein